MNRRAISRRFAWAVRDGVDGHGLSGDIEN
jgi:hypothetical protein